MYICLPVVLNLREVKNMPLQERKLEIQFIIVDSIVQVYITFFSHRL